MKIIFQSKNKYVVRYDKGEDVIAGLIKLAREQNIEAGFFFGIGAAKEVTLSFYDIERKEYLDNDIKENLEIVSLQGNIAKMEKEIIVHAHGSFCDSNMQIRGGHLKKLIVSATCEINLEVLDDKIEREYSSEIGLNLMK